MMEMDYVKTNAKGTAYNNSLDRSGGSVFRVKPGAAKIE
jgi:hypothetical protein